MREALQGASAALRRRSHVLVALVAAVALAIAGAGLAMGAPAAAQADAADQDIAVSGITQWQYRDDDQKPAEGWQTSEVVTGDEWKTAAGSFGAKRGAIASLGGGYTPKNLLNQYRDLDKDGQPDVNADGDKFDVPVFYFRTTFDVKDPSIVKSVTGSFVYDDAATVYINGVRVGGADDGSFDENGYGGSNDSAPNTAELSFSDVAKLNLKKTGNVLSVELHNGRPSSSDVYLDVTKVTLSATDQGGTTNPDNPEPAAADIKNVFVNIGADETQRNFNFLSVSDKDSQVQLVAKPASWNSGDAFPTEGVTTVDATKGAEAAGTYKSYKATATGLAANTTYLYRVGNDADGWSDTYSFSTYNQGANESFSFLVAGDPQIGAGSEATDTQGWQATVANSLAKFPTSSFLLSVGDQVNSKSNQTQYDDFASPEGLRGLTLATDVGNHDSGNELYSAHYNLPNQSEYGQTGNGSMGNDYWFTYNGVLFMSLNSNDTNINEHKAFMESALKANPDASWRVVTFHHAPFSVANHYDDSNIEDFRNNLSPVISDLGIDVVLNGHDHHYTRSYMMDGANPVIPEGHNISKGEPTPTEVTDPAKGQVLYIASDSASGSKYYALNKVLNGQLPNYAAFDWQQDRPTISNVEVTKNSFAITTYQTDVAGLRQIDTFTIRRTPAEVPETDQNLTDDKSGVTVSGKLPEGATLNVIDTSAKPETEAPEGTELVGSYQIELRDAEGAEIQPSGEVSVTVPVKTDADAVTVLHVHDGKTETLSGTAADGKATFKTASFSQFDLYAQKGNQGGNGNQGDNGQGGTVDNDGNVSGSSNGGAEKTQASAEKPAGKGSLPKTGDDTSFAAIAIIAGAGIAVVAAGIVARVRSHRE